MSKTPRKPKFVKIYEEDWAILNGMLFSEQVRRKERLTFADMVHEVLVLAHQQKASV